jgi:hypothetical protein
MTHQYLVEEHRLFRGHPVAVKNFAQIDVGVESPDRSLVAQAKKALGWTGIKTTKKERGDVIFLSPIGQPNYQLSITFSH